MDERKGKPPGCSNPPVTRRLSAGERHPASTMAAASWLMREKVAIPDGVAGYLHRPELMQRVRRREWHQHRLTRLKKGTEAAVEALDTAHAYARRKHLPALVRCLLPNRTIQAHDGERDQRELPRIVPANADHSPAHIVSSVPCPLLIGQYTCAPVALPPFRPS